MIKFTPLYEFSVIEKTEKPVKKTETVDGKTITTETTEIVESPVKIIFKRPNRSEERDADLFYAKRSTYYVEQGLMTKAMLINKYKDSGGFLSKKASKDILDSVKRQSEITEEIALLKADGKKLSAKKKEKVEALETEFASFGRIDAELQAYQESIMAQTADAKATDDLFYWYMLNFTHFQRGDDDVEAFFRGDDFESKLASLDEMEENPSDYHKEVTKKVNLIAYLWLYNRGVETEKFKEVIDKASV